MPEDLKNSPEFTFPKPASTHKAYSLVELVYRSQRYEGDSRIMGSRARARRSIGASGTMTPSGLRHPAYSSARRALRASLLAISPTTAANDRGI
jgi:hypothetical protein